MQSVSLDERVEKVKNNEEDINCFVEEYKPFIASCTEKMSGRYVRYGEDDELSIALIAFVEAIRSYDRKKGSFLSFAQNVIKRRLIDYYRKEKRHRNVISIDEYSSEDYEEKDLSMDKSIQKHHTDWVSEYRRLEIEELKKELLSWNITFLDLTKSSPKHEKTRKLCAEIITYILTQSDLLGILKNKKYLPVADIEKALKIPRKKIERSRKYIIAGVIVLTGDYQYIKDYIRLGVIE